MYIILFVITARRTNGESVVYQETLNGSRMVPNGESLATKLFTEPEAQRRMAVLRTQFAGLKEWDVEKRFSYAY